MLRFYSVLILFSLTLIFNRHAYRPLWPSYFEMHEQPLIELPLASICCGLLSFCLHFKVLLCLRFTWLYTWIRDSRPKRFQEWIPLCCRLQMMSGVLTQCKEARYRSSFGDGSIDSCNSSSNSELLSRSRGLFARIPDLGIGQWFVMGKVTQ